jgi:hypothetical protein
MVKPPPVPVLPVPEEMFMVYPPEKHYQKWDGSEINNTLSRYGYKP